jgi:hypothetical protein
VSEPIELIACIDLCGLRVENPVAAGWNYLEMQRRFRCGGCARLLILAREIPGTAAEEFTDPLPSTSRGALPKETASTIAAPTVKPHP